MIRIFFRLRTSFPFFFIRLSLSLATAFSALSILSFLFSSSLKIDNGEKAVASELKRKADKEERKRNPQPKKNSNQLILNIKIPRVLDQYYSSISSSTNTRIICSHVNKNFLVESIVLLKLNFCHPIFCNLICNM